MSEAERQKEDALRAGIRLIWEKSRPVVRERISVLEHAHAQLLAGALTEAERGAAEREAHKLAGSLGTFGFHDASAAAAALEAKLSVTGADPAQLLELIDRIRRETDAA